MSAKLLPILFILLFVWGCQSDPSPNVSSGGSSTTPPVFDTAPGVYDLSPPNIVEDTQSNWIFLGYSDAENDVAASCQVFNRDHVNVTSPCVCFAGVCRLKVTPFANYSGPVSFYYSVTANNFTSQGARVVFNVTSVSDAPTAAAREFTMVENTTYVSDGTLSHPHLSGSDPDGDPLICIKVTDPATGILNLNADCSFAYTPPLDFEGTDLFTFKVNDGTTDSAPVTVKITVTHQNEIPTSGNLSLTAYQNIPASFTMTYVDPDMDTMFFYIKTAPAHGTISGTGATRTYTPANDYTGADSFTYFVSDGIANSNVSTVTINVLPHTIYLRAGGNDATGVKNDATKPFATAQAATNAGAMAVVATSKPVVIDVGAGNFGNITLNSNFGTSISWKGVSAATSIIGNITASGTNGANSSYSTLPVDAQWNGSDGTSGFTISIDADTSVTFGNVFANGGNGGLHTPDVTTQASIPGKAGSGGTITLKGIFGTVSALGGDGHSGGNGGSVTVLSGGITGAIDVSGGLDRCTIASSCKTVVGGGTGGIVRVNAGGTVNGNITSRGAETLGVAPSTLVAGSGGTITVLGSVVGNIFADGGNSYDASVGMGGSVTVNSGGTVSGNISVVSGTTFNNGDTNDAGTVVVRGTAQNIYAQSAGFEGNGGNVDVYGTVKDVYVQSDSSSCTESAPGSVIVWLAGVAQNIYASGGSAACSTPNATVIDIYGRVTGTIDARGGDNALEPLESAGKGGKVTVNSAANVNTIKVDGGNAAVGSCSNGGDGGSITVLTGATYNAANFTYGGGTGDAGCLKPNGNNGTLTIL